METQSPLKERVFVFVRHLLTFVGAFFIGKQFFGADVTDSLLQQIGGVLIMLAGFVWSFVEKEVTLEKAQGFLRQFATAIGGVLLALGLEKEAATVEQVTGIIFLLLPMLQSILMRNKSQKAAEDRTYLAKLKK